ncbi:DUF2721 domain-containing protein [Bradyrhizobium sp. BR 10261]|uniref:DUF2721 domain-containing protein n=1 Tax=Bradyrhizobium sp. BR 10261 TaxID=2749992 RepID=UPI001C6507D4|nr:DUF2721 domain-containing protein [Bradyrhizobium sp. BR 10261]MBW7966794.1 DUF2721 domain-containing protein [Bradyrhizobium sp. BR 10261]
MLPIVTPSVNQLNGIIAAVAAPAFLLGAVAAFISVLVSGINRVVDRAQFLHVVSDGDDSKSYLKADLSRLQRRAVLLNRALFCGIPSAIFTALIIVAFISATFRVAHSTCDGAGRSRESSAHPARDHASAFCANALSPESSGSS